MDGNVDGSVDGSVDRNVDDSVGFLVDGNVSPIGSGNIYGSVDPSSATTV